MRILLLIFLTSLLPLFSLGQDTTIYSYSHGFGGSRITLLDSNKFTYRIGSCTFRSLDKGTYIKNKRRLILNFEDSGPFGNDSFALEKTVCNNDSCNFKITVSNVFGDNVPFMIVQILQNGEKITAFKTNYYGIGETKIPKSNEPFELVISGVRYKKNIIPISNSLNNYKINLIVDSKNSTISKFKKGDIIKRRILEETDDYIIFKDRGGQTQYDKFKH